MAGVDIGLQGDYEQGDVVERISTEAPCRKNQIELLLTLMGQGDQNAVPGLFVYGHTATGKSLVTNAIFNLLQVPHVIVNCIEYYTPKRMFEYILNELSGIQPTPENNFSIYARCDNMNDFVRILKQMTDQEDIKQTIYVVLDKAERLRDMSANLLPAFLRLAELTSLNVCTVLLTDIVWDKFRTGTGALEPYLVHFPDYTKEELLEIMSLDCPEDFKSFFYRNYCNLVLSIFHLACRDLGELRHLALLNFPKYVEPIRNGEATTENQAKLWRNVEPHLRKALQTVYLREVSSAQWERLQQQENLDAASSVIPQTATSLRTKVELPFYSKYLLISAYLASYNPAKTDKRFFAKYKAGVGKRSQLASMKKHERTSNQLLGPKPFPLDRLMAIFYSVAEGRIAPTANIFSQLSSLVTLGLLTQIGSSDPLEAPKFKCLVSLDFMKPIARSVDFEIVRYLYDFV